MSQTSTKQAPGVRQQRLQKVTEMCQTASGRLPDQTL